VWDETPVGPRLCAPMEEVVETHGTVSIDGNYKPLEVERNNTLLRRIFTDQAL